MNDPRDNEQTDKEMIERIAAIGRAAWDARVTADNAAQPPRAASHHLRRPRPVGRGRRVAKAPGR